MLNRTFENLFALSFVLFFFAFVSSLFILGYSAHLYKKVKKEEPDFFVQKNVFSYMIKIRASQFIFYILFNYYKKIRNEDLKKKCYLLRNFTYVVLGCLFFVAIIFISAGVGNLNPL